MHRSLLHKQMLKTTPSSKLMTNEIRRIKKSLWDPYLRSQVETQGTCSMLMAVILFFHFEIDSGGRKRTGSVGASCFPYGTRFFMLADDPSFSPCSVGTWNSASEKCVLIEGTINSHYLPSNQDFEPALWWHLQIKGRKKLQKKTDLGNLPRDEGKNSVLPAL